jgi:peptidylprolyl isomerase
MLALRIRAIAVVVLTTVAASAENSAPALSSAGEQAPADVAQPPKNARPSASGVVSRLLRAGHGSERPGRNDCVKAEYTLWKRDGTLLGGSRHGSQPGNACLRTMFPGMAEAVKLMALGEQRRIWIPAKLTYAGDDDDKPAPLDVTVDFELLAIQKAPPVPPDLKLPPRNATKLESGVSFRRIKKGTGTQHPSGKSRMLLQFSGWTVDGDLIESSVMAGQPASFDMLTVLRGWRETLLHMVPGDKVRVWIPAAMAFGDKPRRGQPKGDVVYELELLSLNAGIELAP